MTLGRHLGLSGPVSTQGNGVGGGPTLRAQSPSSSSSPEALGSLNYPLGSNLSSLVVQSRPGGMRKHCRGKVWGPGPAQGPQPAAPSSPCSRDRPTG